MISDKKGKYSIFFGKYREGKIEQDKTEISVDKVDIFENFDFYDYSIFNASIGNLKEYFLTNFSQNIHVANAKFLYIIKMIINIT